MTILACILGAYGRRIQGGWFSGYRWTAFPIYALCSALVCYPNAYLIAPVLGVVCAWFTIQTNNGSGHWFPPVRWLYAALQKLTVPAMPWIGVNAGGYTELAEVVLGFLSFLFIGPVVGAVRFFLMEI